MNANLKLETVAAAVSDGAPVDWSSAALSVSTDEESRIIENLRVISTLSHLHQSARELEVSDTLPLGPDQPRTIPRWGHFVLLERIGSGAHGDVFRAIDTRLDREVALKLLNRFPQASEVPSLLHEARLLARIRHENVVTVYGADLIDGRVGLSMELIAGQSLDDIVAQRGPANAFEAAIIGIDLCRALAAVHGASLLHRDVKAQNVMRESGGRYVLMDFGTGHDASDTARGSRRAGTPVYLAPEVLRGEPASIQSDIYALGVLLFYLTSQRFPIRARNVQELVDGHARGQSEHLADIRPELPKAFHDAVARALAPQPSARFRSAAAMADALSNVLPQPVESTLRRRWLPVGLLAASLATAVVTWSVLNRPTPIAGVDTRPPVVAVLPFQDLSPAQAAGHLATGLTDVLITDFGQSAHLSVLARTTSKEFVGLRGMATLARDYGVTAVVDGAIQPEGDQLHTTIRVVNASTGAVLWSREYTHALNSTLAMRREVVGQVAGLLKATFDEASLTRQSAGMNSLAFENYFRGWSEYFLLTRASMNSAQQLFEAVVQADPNFAPAHAALAQVKFVRATSFREWPAGSSYRGALDEAARSIETARALDSGSSYAAAVSGLIRFTGYWDWSNAERELVEATKLNPSDAQSRGLYAQLLMAQHRLEPALLEARRAEQLDPLNPSRVSQVAICLYYLRRFEESLAETERLLARDPSSSIGRLAAARALSALGRHDDALAMLSTGGRTQEPPIRAELARILAAAGRDEEARAALPSLESAYQGGALAPDYLAYLLLALGERERAVALLSEAVDQHSASVVWIKVDPRFDALRTDARFAELLQRIGLEP